MLNNWRMAQLHAHEAPDRIYELERWGALFDRTKDGRILQRDFGGHRYAAARSCRRPHRPGAHPDAAAAGRDARHRRLHGVQGTASCFKDVRRHRRRRGGVLAAHGRVVAFTARSVVLATGSVGKAWLYTSTRGSPPVTATPWHVGRFGLHRHGGSAVPPDGHGLAVVGPRHPRHRGRARRRRGPRNTEGHRFMFDYIPPNVHRRDGRHRRRRPTVGTTTTSTTGGHRSCYPATRSPGRSTPRSRRAG